MNIAVTNGLSLMPPAFRNGLGVWSQGNGLPGESTWRDARNVGIVPADADFGPCLEILKERMTTSLRFIGETPMIPGVYLRVSAQIKLMSGPGCGVRIAGWAGDADRRHVDGLTEFGREVSVTKHGQVVEVSAIVGVGSRRGVDMSWGTQPVFGHFGLDLTGANGGAFRIESLRIEDVTAAFVPSLIDWVDVRDFGAVGDGETDDRAAFLRADAAAKGGGIVVPEGKYFIGDSMSLSAAVRFKGTLKMRPNDKLSLLKSFDFPTYADAFGDETLGLKKAVQALFGYTDHVALDLCGRRVDLTEPLVLGDLAPDLAGYSNRRVIMNGSLLAVGSEVWATGLSGSAATYDPADPRVLSNVANVASVEIGSRIIGEGVGREVYVNGRDLETRRLLLSQPLYGGAGTREYRFERYRYVLELLGPAQLGGVELQNLDIICNGIASGVMLPVDGIANVFRDCTFRKPKDRGITSIGRGCQGMQIDRCQFYSNESALPAQQRNSVAINANANDLKVRNCRFVRFAHFMVANGTGHIISGNHWFQGDSTGANGLRFAGLVLTTTNVQTTVTCNYVDNASIEWTNEHSARPGHGGRSASFGALTITGNTFLASHMAGWFSWLVIKPYGPGHSIRGLNVSGNVFKAYFGEVDRVERVDNSVAELDFGAMSNIRFEGNTFDGIKAYVSNPLRLDFCQNSAASRWVTPETDGLPFGGWAQSVDSIVAESAIVSSSGQMVGEMPWIEAATGTNKRQIRLNWTRPVKGCVAVHMRMDRVGK